MIPLGKENTQDTYYTHKATAYFFPVKEALTVSCMATAIGITIALLADSLLDKFPPRADILDNEEFDEEGAKEDCCGCKVVGLSSSLLTSTLGKELVLVSGLRMADSTKGELPVRPRSSVFLLGTGTGFLTTLVSDSEENDNDADTSGTLLLSVFFKVSVDIVARRLLGNGGTSSTCMFVVLVVVAVVVGLVCLASSTGDEDDVLVPDAVLFKRLPFPEGGLGSIGDPKGGGLGCTELQKCTNKRYTRVQFTFVRIMYL